MAESLPNWLRKRAHLSPDRDALIFEGNTYTFKQVFENAALLAGKFRTIGLENGSCAAVLFSNNANAVFMLYALQMAGVRTVILNNRLTSDELSWQLRDSKAEIMFFEPDFAEKASLIESAARLISLEEVTNLPDAEAIILDEYDLNDVTTIMYTSGTTGNPKGVMQTYGNHWWSATASALNLGLDEQDKWLCTVPIFHISGYSILMRSQIYGTPVVLHRSFEAGKVIEDIREHQVTVMSVVSTMLRRIVEELADGKLPETFRCMLLGGGPAPLPLLEACLEKSIPVFQTYGMTETASQFATLSPEYCISHLGSAGKALFPGQIRIVDEDGNDLPVDKEGEILVKGPNVTIGYLNKEDVTAEKIRNQWLHTGDIGYMDKEGFLFVLDRRSDLIISGGENVYPAEIEGVILSHPSVADAGVIGMEDEQWGQVPVAFIVTHSDCEVGEDDLKAFCSVRLAKYKLPQKIYFTKDLPRNAAKKLLRRKLREQIGLGREGE